MRVAASPRLVRLCCRTIMDVRFRERGVDACTRCVIHAALMSYACMLRFCRVRRADDRCGGVLKVQRSPVGSRLCTVGRGYPKGTGLLLVCPLPPILGRSVRRVLVTIGLSV